MAERELIFSDIERAAKTRDPQLAELVLRYLEQPDPPPGQPEVPPEEELKPKDEQAMQKFLRAVSPASLAHKTATERKAARREAWDAILASENPPPRFAIGPLLVELYDAGDEPAKSALIEIFREARIAFGVWQAMKRVYKNAEARHDAAMFGVLAYRFDAVHANVQERSRVSPEIALGTFIYLSRRAWRYLRQLGRAVPELYPQFAVQVLKHYPARFEFRGTWVANQIWAHQDLIGRGRPGRISAAPKDFEKKRAYPEAWKLSPEPLLRLLEDAQSADVAEFAIKSLEKDHPEALRNPDPRWIARIGMKPLGVIHDLVVKLLTELPELHASKLRALGLHDMVLSMLGSYSAAARKFAIEYATVHAKDMSVSELMRWATSSSADARVFAAARLAEKDARELGLEVLVRLLEVREASAMATAKIKESYSPRDVTEQLFVALFRAGHNQRKFVLEMFESAKVKPPAAFYRAVLDDPKSDDRARETAMRALAGYTGKEIGGEWLKKALFDPRLSDWTAQLLRGGILGGDELDVEWIKSLIVRPRFRPVAIDVLSNTTLVAPKRIGLTWLLEQARKPDEATSQFAHHLLLAHFAPSDFEGGVSRLWALASAKSEPEVVRKFAATYLELHHPVLGPTKKEGRSLGIKPLLTHGDYAIEYVRPLFDDERADVRRLAAMILAQEVVRWNEPRLLYQLAGGAHRELRTAAGELLLSIGEADADPARVPPLEWLLPNEIFALAESSEKTARELALALIRRHYDRLGGASRLAWLMESPDRDVRLFAVRLLWEKYRQRAFESEVELVRFLRTTLFGLPPGRMERRELSAEVLPDRAVAASVAKRRLIEVVRELAVEDVEFAKVVTPVLEELAVSVAKGEWQASVTALAWIKRAHPDLSIKYGAVER